MNEKQQQLTFDKGITNVPSDALCSDNTLQDCVGMVYDNGEHRPIQKPNQYISGFAGAIVFIHRPNSQTANYIYTSSDGTEIRWGVYVLDHFEGRGTLMAIPAGSTIQTMAIGKTLIVNREEGVSCFVWKGSGYTQLTSNLPDIDIDFRLVDFEKDEGGDGGKTFHIFTVPDEPGEYKAEFDPDSSDGNQRSYNDVVVGQYNGRRKEIKEQKRFVGPFFVRAALKMYDGTYARMTPPVLMVPTMSYNSEAKWFYDRGEKSFLYVQIYSCELQYYLHTNYEDYSDLISDVVLFVTKEVETNNMDADFIRPGYESNKEIISIYANPPGVPARKRNVYVQNPSVIIDEYTFNRGVDVGTLYGFNILIPRSENDINEDIKELGIFYKLAEIGITANNDWQYASNVIRDNVLPNLETQERLTDEYFGHSVTSGKYAYVYNARLNLTNVRRSVFEGFSKMVSYDWYTGSTADSHSYKVFVTIETFDGNTIVKKEFASTERFGMWFYYPDARAKHVKIFKDNLLIVDEVLKEHLGLNGAYYFSGLPFSGEYNPTGVSAPLPSSDDNPWEELNNSIVTSEVNNPFAFSASGYNQAGEGTVLAVVSNTYALSQGQFGQYPLIVFTTKGIWAMNTDNTGLFISSVPLSREVCNNTYSITQTDGSVFFSSKKGLMALVGADVKCMSGQLKGSFLDFLKTAKIAYDYKDSLLWIFGTNADCYVYALKSATLHKSNAFVENSNVNISVVNDYPDNIIQVGSNVYSLTGKPEEHHDTLTYDAVMETRPMKLENALALKSIMQIRHILQMEGTMTMKIYASNNLKTDANSWVELHSLRGTPWKYYKFRYDFKDMKATDRFAGTMLITQERRTNKLR